MCTAPAMEYSPTNASGNDAQGSRRLDESGNGTDGGDGNSGDGGSQ